MLKAKLWVLTLLTTMSPLGSLAQEVLEYDSDRRNSEGYRASIAYTVSKGICERRTQQQDKMTVKLRHTDREFLDFCNSRLKECFRPLTGVYLVDDYPWEQKTLAIDTAAQALGVPGASSSRVGWCHFIANGKGVEVDDDYSTEDCMSDFGRIVLDFLRTEEGQAKVGARPVDSSSAVGAIPQSAACMPREQVIDSIKRFHLPIPRGETYEQRSQRYRAERALLDKPVELERAILNYLTARFPSTPASAGSANGGGSPGSAGGQD